MRIKKIKIKNFKCYAGTFEVLLNEGVNIIVGGNESGKSTILEAIHLALTGMLNGRHIRNDLSSYLFNLAVESSYVKSLATATPLPPPSILIELFFSGDGKEFADLEGDGNSDTVKGSGVAYKIEFDRENYGDAYAELIKTGGLKSIPVEYYSATMASFARKGITARNIPIKSAFIDSASSRFQNGSDVYISRIIRDSLEEKERASISQAHRKLREAFTEDAALKLINAKITAAAKISKKSVSVSVDLSSQTAWESSLMTYIDNIPFHYIGKGEQCIIKTKLALSSKKNGEATTLLIEEPENHLSHGRLSQLVRDLSSEKENKQVIISTHSSFVANKLGLENLVLLRQSRVVRIGELKSNEFFKKLAGYDTLRLVLAKKAILVEGDSDELVVQRAYMDTHEGRLPIEDEIDVISVGTSFLRFLELAKELKVPVAVVTDSDGKPEALRKKYVEYEGIDHIKICFDEVVDGGDLKIGNRPFNYNTLEPKLLKSNGLEVLAPMFGIKASSDDELHIHMHANKTDCALAIFSAARKINYPDFIVDAIAI
ncbi:MAG: AAA family ATPase [Polaromonas sp.]|uniref:ATP-dependent nuclease n=1 Tax=Polaromonas sp. TaxID=1869339 RepID=UPI00272F737B|nr:AAA family ATPase [Polaromonas sp.]MDP2451005.1 AAA family ATPase [Polaromonas sp.]MDP3248508.1 AAA family ATPase [Polaromonas sp.]MDP3757414.1 AAA family ATPase [Polaromonas sp.]